MDNVTIAKSIAGAAVAFALVACSAENAAAPENTVSSVQQNEETHKTGTTIDGFNTSKKVDSVAINLILENLQAHTLSQDIAIEPLSPCPDNKAYPNDRMWCHKLQLENGRIFFGFAGSGESAVCEHEYDSEEHETVLDTISYSVSMDGNVVTKTITNTVPEFSFGALGNIYDMIEAFEKSCTNEGGKITESSFGKTSCEVEISPCDNEFCLERTEPVYMYQDPNWNQFATMTIDVCRNSFEQELDGNIIDVYLEGHAISNMIMVDHWCVENPDYPDNPWWCLPVRSQLESGTVYNSYEGLSNAMFCETSSDTLSYNVFLNVSSKTITKKLSRNLVNYIPHVMDEFRDSCETEGGTIMEDNEGTMVCSVKISACDREYCQDSVEPEYFYTDPSWKLFATKAIEPCRMSDEQ